MALTLTNITFSNPADKSEVEQNFYDVQQKFNGGIVDADISSSAAISNSKLETRYERMTVQLKFMVIYDGVDARIWSDFGANQVLDFVCLPGDGGDVDWTIETASWGCNAVGDGTAQFRLSYGYYDTDTGGWSLTQTVSTVTITKSTSGGAGSGHQGVFITDANGAVTTLPFASSNNRTMLALTHFADGTAGNAMDDYGDQLTVAVTLKRAIGVV